MYRRVQRKNFEVGNCPSPVSGALIYFLCKTNRKIYCLWAPDWDKSQIYSHGSSLPLDVKIKKFDMKMKFKNQTNGFIM
jgi:hypothetical protein